MRRPSLLRRLGWRLRIGHRAAFLLLFGAVYVAIGFSVWLAPLPPTPDLFHTRLPLPVRLGLWTVCGTGACAVARHKGLQWIGFALLAPPMMALALSYAWSLIGHVIHYVGASPLWLRVNGLMLYLLILMTVRLVASWPDPPEDEPWRP